MKILALYGPKEFEKYYNADVYPLYKNMFGVKKMLFKLYEHIHFCNVSKWLDDWKYNVADYDLIFIFDGIRGRDVIEYIRKHNPKARIIIYYINPLDVTDRKAPQNYDGLGCEFYTFDPVDAKNFGIKFKPYFFPEEYMIDCDEKVAIEQDIFFIGVDKGRLNVLKDLHVKFQKLKLSDKLMVIATPHERYTKDDAEYLSERLAYEDIVKNIKKSRAVLEILQPGQSGITYRSMEAIFYNKKLITNNVHIKSYEFYDPRNIFILQERNINELNNFLKLPILEINQDIKNKYKFSGGWLKEFLQNSLVAL